MVKITIIGWYGTETIGDRAILAGMFNIFSEKYSDYIISLGSIYPFYTEKTIIEDYIFFKECAKYNNLKIYIFDERKRDELEKAIKKSDFIVIGGGPLLDEYSIFMLEYAFKYAKSKNKKTMIFGCGIGPLNKRRFQKSCINIINKSDSSVFRDSKSIETYFNLVNKNKNKNIITSSLDPACFALEYFKQNNKIEIDKNLISVSIRDFPKVCEYNSNNDSKNINEKIVNFIKKISCTYKDKKILLLPMNYCDSGGDDRKIMNKIKYYLDKNNIQVQNTPLNLKETINIFASSYLCVGMRFHSVVFQTILGGKNIILDYTDVKNGKIVGFLSQIGLFSKYKNRYYNLQANSGNIDLSLIEKNVNNVVNIDFYKNIYLENLPDIK